MSLKKYVREIVSDVFGAQAILCVRGMMKLLRFPDIRNELKRNVYFKNRYYGQRCFIFGTGPSINAIDLSLFADEIVFTVNQMPRNSQFAKLASNFHLWADERFFDIDESRSEDLALLDVMRKACSSNAETVVFYKYAAKEMVKKTRLDHDINNIYYYDEVSVPYLESNINIDFTHCVPSFSTVIHYAICLAVYMGFKEIILLGCDCTGIMNSINQIYRLNANYAYGFEVDVSSKKLMERIHARDSFREELCSYVRLMDDYAVLRDYCYTQNVKIFNATDPTLLDSVERRNISSFFSNKGDVTNECSSSNANKNE